MEYRYLKAFILTAKYLSFSRAAKELHIAQSAVSRQVKLLEESIEEELIIRSSKKVILTHKGEELYFSSLKFDTIISGIFKNSSSTTLKIGVLHGLLKSWLPPIIKEYRKNHDRSLHIEIGEGEGLITKLETGEFDVVFSNTQFQTQTISSKRLFEETFSLISSHNIDLKNLSQYPWITYSSEDGIYKQSKVKSHSILQVDSISTMIKLVREGLGIALVPDHCLAKKQSLKIYPIKSKSKSYIYQTTLSYNTIPSYIEDLTSLL